MDTAVGYSGGAILPAAQFTPALVPYSGGTVDQCLAALNTENTRIAYLCDWEQIAGFIAEGGTARTIPWHRLRPQHVEIIRAELLRRHKTKRAAARRLAALRRLLKTAWFSGQLDADTWLRIKEIKISASSEKLDDQRELTAGDVDRLVNAAVVHQFPDINELEDAPERAKQKGAAAARDLALLALVLNGLRRSEVCALDLADVEAPPLERLQIRKSKGGSRTVPLIDNAWWMLDTWIQHRGDVPGPFLYALENDGKRLLPERIGPQVVWRILEKLSKRAGITPPVRPHQLRHWYVSELDRQGAPLNAMRDLVGHASADTTAAYIGKRRRRDAMKSAARLIRLPEIGLAS